jgi:ABC-type transporter Mla MlaB component
MAAPAPQSVACAIRGPLVRADVPGLCRRATRLLDRSGANELLCDVSQIKADAVAVEALARIQLSARRRGCRARLRDPSSELLALRDLMGLREALPH